MASNISKPALPKGFLEGPPPPVTVSKIDFAKTAVPGYGGFYAVILDGVLTLEECMLLVAAAEQQANGEWERAMINIGGGMQEMMTDIRNCGRIMWDSRDIVEKIWARCKKHVPEILELDRAWPHVLGAGPIKRKETWEATRLNERMRFLKYTGGEYFKRHCDGAYETPDRTERSYFTLHLYLSDVAAGPDGKPLEGGATTFHGWRPFERLDVEPKMGRVLIFQHRNLLHSGDDVISGTKLTMRTDIMYRRKEVG